MRFFRFAGFGGRSLLRGQCRWREVPTSAEINGIQAGAQGASNILNRILFPRACTRLRARHDAVNLPRLSTSSFVYLSLSCLPGFLFVPFRTQGTPSLCILSTRRTEHLKLHRTHRVNIFTLPCQTPGIHICDWRFSQYIFRLDHISPLPKTIGNLSKKPRCVGHVKCLQI